MLGLSKGTVKSERNSKDGDEKEKVLRLLNIIKLMADKTNFSYFIKSNKFPNWKQSKCPSEGEWLNYAASILWNTIQQ